MISNSTIQFLKQLKLNNNKVWFDAHRGEYEAVKKEMNLFCEAVIKELSKFDKNMMGLEPKQCVFRINRDVRFSKDKSPYKTNIGAYFSKGGKKSDYCGYYFHLQPGGKSMIGGGMWQPMPPQIAKARQEIDYNFSSFQKIINQKDFKTHFGKPSGDKLVNPPKGYDAANPAIDYLKHKGWVVTHPFTDKEIGDKDFLKTFIKSAKLMKPWLDFFNTTVGE